MTLSEIENYSPIVFGHFSIAVGLSIMYTPYAEQTMACLIYVVLSVPLLFCNAGRHRKCTMIMWSVMAAMVMFMLSCGLLEVGQSNWDRINNTCFALEYSSIY